MVRPLTSSSFLRRVVFSLKSGLFTTGTTGACAGIAVTISAVRIVAVVACSSIIISRWLWLCLPFRLFLLLLSFRLCLGLCLGLCLRLCHSLVRLGLRSARLSHCCCHHRIVVHTTILKEEVSGHFLVLITREVGLGSRLLRETESLEALNRFHLIAAHLNTTGLTRLLLGCLAARTRGHATTHIDW